MSKTDRELAQDLRLTAIVLSKALHGSPIGDKLDLRLKCLCAVMGSEISAYYSPGRQPEIIAQITELITDIAKGMFDNDADTNPLN